MWYSCGEAPDHWIEFVQLFFRESDLSLSKPLAHGSFPVYVSVVCLDMGVIWPLNIYAVLYDPNGTDYSLQKSVNSTCLGLGHDIKGYRPTSQLVR